MRQAIATTAAAQQRLIAQFCKAGAPLLRAVRTFSDGISDGADNSLHSKDIAFKPNQDGWGFTSRYSGA